MRLVLLIPLFAVALEAGPITVIQTKSPTGVADSSYVYDVPDFAGPVTALVRGQATCPYSPTCDQDVTATIDLTMDLYTPGPVRGGIALLQLFTISGGSAGGGAQESGAIGPYSLGTCPKEMTCSLNGYFPFELGVPFTIDLSGFAYGFPPLGGGDFLVSASLQLYEASQQDGVPVGAPVQINLITEPGSASLAFTGLVALLLFAGSRILRLRLLKNIV